MRSYTQNLTLRREPSTKGELNTHCCCNYVIELIRDDKICLVANSVRLVAPGWSSVYRTEAAHGLRGKSIGDPLVMSAMVRERKEAS